jgi:uncharacterized protein (TIGR03067 family)
MRYIGFLTVAAGFVIGAVDHQERGGAKQHEAEKKELEKVTGVWIQAGENVPPENAKARLIYRGREFEGRLDDKILFTGSVRLDPTRTPKELDLTLGSGPNKGKTLLGVYELDAENYRGCLAEPDQPRPAKLTPEPQSGQRPFAFRRVTDQNDPAVAAEAELKRFEGTWSYASAVVEGEPEAAEELKKQRLTLRGNRFTLTMADATHRGTYAVDPTATPKTIDVTFSEGPQAGRIGRGIYDLNGDTCNVCMGRGDRPRPTEFASKPSSGLTLEVLKRVKP